MIIDRSQCLRRSKHRQSVPRIAAVQGQGGHVSNMVQMLVAKQYGFYLGLFLGSQSRGDGTGVDDQFFVHQQAGKAGAGSFGVMTAQESDLHDSGASNSFISIGHPLWSTCLERIEGTRLGVNV